MQITMGVVGMMMAAATVSAQTVWDEHGTLQVSSNGRYLEHSDGTPFFWLGGTAWGMGSRTTRQDVDLYLDNRAAKGFTVVQAVAHWRHSSGTQDGWGPRVNNPVNPYGHVPFAGGEADPDTTSPLIVPGGSPDDPNDYWDHIDYIVRETRARGLALSLLPTWSLQSIASSDPNQVVFTIDEARAYGQFLGERYGDQPHIIWTLGGDTTGFPKEKYDAMAEGIATGIANVGGISPLITFHPSSGRASISAFDDAPWLDVNMLQSGQRGLNEVGPMVSRYYNRSPARPVINAEASYEGVTQWANNLEKSPYVVRRTAYESYFRGAAGFTYGHGNSPGAGTDAVWAFAEDGDTWRALLDAPGAQDMTHVKELIASRKWWNWVPDQSIITGDTTHVLVNQKVDGGGWVSLGKFNFDGQGVIEVSNTATDGFVIADAIRFVGASGTLIVDNPDATAEGSWTVSTSTNGYQGSNYLHDGNTGKGDKRVLFSQALDGEFEVFARWTTDNNRASNVPIAIHGDRVGSSMMLHSAVRSIEGDELLVYFASRIPATIALGSITTSDEAFGQWFNPADGSWLALDGTFATSGAFEFTPPSGWQDAVLVMQAVPEPASAALLLGAGGLLLRRSRRRP